MINKGEDENGRRKKRRNRIKEKIIEILNKHSIQSIDVKEFSFEQIQHSMPDYVNYIHSHEVIACAGNINPGICQNYFGIEELMISSRTSRFENFINLFNDKNIKEDIYQDALQLLKETTRALNCDLAVKSVRSLIDAFEIENVYMNQQSKMNMVLHLGYGIERMLLNQRIKFTQIESFMKQNEIYVILFNKYKYIIEEEFQVEFNQDEICYAIQVLINSQKTKCYILNR